MKTKTIITELTQEDLVNLLCTATYGSNWLSCYAPDREGVDITDGDCLEDEWAKCLIAGKKITCTDYNADEGEHYGTLEHYTEEDGQTTYLVSLQDIINGLQIDSDLFTIVPLKSIDEFRYEGTYLDHCVFRCGYYKKESSLILSARDGHNNPIETIEINLNTFTIMQCYGVHDSHSALHDKIVKTMQENMWRVREIASGKKKKARVAA